MTASAPPVRDVTAAHYFDPAPLEAWLRREVEDFGDGMVVHQFQGGASNPTFLLTTQASTGLRRYVLRKKPPGVLLASAHQVDREYKVMKALDGHVPVPKMRALCTDDAVIGTSFYVMDYLEGRIFRDAKLPDQTPAERAAIYDDLNATLAKLHKVDFEAVGLGDYGKAGGYFERQVARWTKQYRASETDHLEPMERLIEYLARTIPEQTRVSVVHGDYRNDNLIMAKDRADVRAVLDW